MKAFLTSLVAVLAIGLASDFVFGGAITKSGVFGEEITKKSGTMLIDTSAAGANISPNVRLPGQGEAEPETEAAE
jgi:hypothetical protein